MSKAIIEMTKEEWIAKGRSILGENMLTWKFKCPCCGHIQTPEDFRQYKEQGVSPDTAYFNCIGRYDGHEATNIFSCKSPCNYTSGGLFNFNPIVVIDGEKRISTFAFAE